MLKLKALIYAAGGLVMAGCVNGQTLEQASRPDPTARPYELTSEYIEVVKSGVARGLKDPYTAQFSDLRATINGKGLISVCGFVNARNSYGAYGGMQPFMGGLAPENMRGEPVFIVAGIGHDYASSAAAVLVCRQNGIQL